MSLDPTITSRRSRRTVPVDELPHDLDLDRPRRCPETLRTERIVLGPIGKRVVLLHLAVLERVDILGRQYVGLFGGFLSERGVNCNSKRKQLYSRLTSVS
jgi:hypothetical protein